MPTGKRWYTQENCHMLYGMLQNPPIAPDEWKRCADLHREGYPERDDVSQRRQYNKLVLLQYLCRSILYVLKTGGHEKIAPKTGLGFRLGKSFWPERERAKPHRVHNSGC